MAVLEKGSSKDTETEEAIPPIISSEDILAGKLKVVTIKDSIYNEEAYEKSKEGKEEKSSGIKRPWHALVSYVDELTVGGRRNSKGQFVDRFPKFPGFGKNVTAKVPQDCFPQHCYQRFVEFKHSETLLRSYHWELRYNLSFCYMGRCDVL